MMSDSLPPRPVVAIAGASGFVGSRMMAHFGEKFQWVGLTRSATVAGKAGNLPGVQWRQCDLFSLPQVEQALEGAEVAIYLVHSMLPSSRLVQGSFRDMDVLLADNFARAAKEAGVRHIIYLGGLIPENTESLSPHLASRLEVEDVLRECGVPVTVLRAGLILGPGGSSTQMLINLVHRLPFMILPKWTSVETQSVDIRDVIRALDVVIHEPALHGGTYDLAGHAVMTYREMILKTASIMEKKRLHIYFPYHSIKLSRLWVRLVSGVPSDLVNPLLESLTYPLRARPNAVLERISENCVPFEQSVIDAMRPEGGPVANPRAVILKTDRSLMRAAKRVRSVQRLPLPEGWDAEKVAQEYGQWLTGRLLKVLRVERGGDGELRFLWRFPRLELLVLTPTPYSRTGGRRRAFYITGGLLALQVEPPGRLEFRLLPELGCIIAAIHGFAPRLPWWLYSLTQAKVHLVVMRLFGRHLRRAAERS